MESPEEFHATITAMAANYTYNGPVDCTKEPSTDSIKGKTVIVTGGMLFDYYHTSWSALGRDSREPTR